MGEESSQLKATARKVAQGSQVEDLLNSDIYSLPNQITSWILSDDFPTIFTFLEKKEWILKT